MHRTGDRASGDEPPAGIEHLESPALDVPQQTIPGGREVRVVRIQDCGIRRGPAKEAHALYEVGGQYRRNM